MRVFYRTAAWSCTRVPRSRNVHVSARGARRIKIARGRVVLMPGGRVASLAK